MTVSVPAVISAARAGSSATIAAVLTEPWPLPMMRRFAARSAADGRAMSGPATEPIWIQSSGRLRSRRRGEEGADGVLGGRAPEVVDDDVDVGGGLAERVVVERDGDVGAELGQRREALGVTACADHVAGAEVLGDLDGHLARRCRSRRGRARAARAAMAIRVRSAIQEDIAGFIAAAIAATSLSAGSGTLRRRSTTVCSAIEPSVVSGQDEVDEIAVGGAADAIDARDQRQFVAARVVRAVGAGAHARVQAGGEHVDDELVLAARLGRLDGLVAGRVVEGTDDGGVHGGPLSDGSWHELI